MKKEFNETLMHWLIQRVTNYPWDNRLLFEIMPDMRVARARVSGLVEININELVFDAHGLVPFLSDDHGHRYYCVPAVYEFLEEEYQL